MAETGNISRIDEQEKTKRLNLMRYWLFGTFVIVFAAVTAAIVTYTMGLARPLEAVRIGLPIWGIVGVACIAFFYGYKFLYLKNQ